MTMIGVKVLVSLTVRGPLLIHASDVGPWGIDAIAMRNADGLLVIPGDQLQGKVREAMEDLGIESAATKRSEELSRSIQRSGDESKDFTTSQEENLDAHAVRYPIQFSDLLSNPSSEPADHPARAGIQTVTQVKMDSESGATDSRMLRVLDCPIKPGKLVEFIGELRFFAESETAAREQFDRIRTALGWVISFGSQKTVGFGRLTKVADVKKASIETFKPAPFDIPADCQQFLIDFTFSDPVCVPEGLANGNLYETRQEIPGEALRGSVVGLLHRVLGTNPLSLDFPDSVQKTGSYQELCRWFARIRLTTARPVDISLNGPDTGMKAPSIPRVIPKSLGLVDETFHDFASLPANIDAEWNAKSAPAFFPDWKSSDWTKVSDSYGICRVPTELRVRTAIDSGMRRAHSGNLFAYQSLRPHGKAWRATLSIDRRPDAKGFAPTEADCSAAVTQLISLLETGWLSVSKTKARGKGTVVAAGSFPRQIPPVDIDGQRVYVIVLRGPALMIDPRKCVDASGCMKSLNEIDALYAEFWQQASKNALTEIPDRRFKSDSLVGGFQARQYRYSVDQVFDFSTESDPAKRADKQKSFPYNPTLVVDPGSVFVMKVSAGNEQAASAVVADWLANGLPLPEWAKKAYGDTHHTNIFLPQNGFGEIEVAGAAFVKSEHWQSLVERKTFSLELTRPAKQPESTASSPHRCVITARLTTQSPLAIHTGVSTHDLRALGELAQDKMFRAELDEVHDGVEDCDALIARDYCGKPYIPGSSLKGVIREWLTRPAVYEKNKQLIEWMLGKPSSSDSVSADEGAGGAVVFEDAFLVEHPDNKTIGRHLPFFDPSQLTFVEQHISINRRTGAVKHGALYNTEAVPAGLSFQVRLIVDHDRGSSDFVNQSAKLLQTALAAFNSKPECAPPQMGSDTRNGWGRMAVKVESIEQWTPSGRKTQPLTVITPVDAIRRRRIAIRIRLKFSSAFTTLDPARTLIASGLNQNPPAFKKGVEEFFLGQPMPIPDSSPRMVTCRIVPPSNSNGREWDLYAQPLLPAASFKGAFRSQTEKILRTMHSGIGVSPHGQLEPVTKQSPEFVWRLLGLESQQSAIWCSDFVGDKELKLHLREMVAIDRFTGGAAASKKYNALVFQGPTLTGTLALDLPDDNDSARKMLGAVALAMRDLIEGDITFGYGETKGFGECVAEIISVRQSGIDAARLTERMDAPKSGDLNNWLFRVVELVRNGQTEDCVALANDYLNLCLDAVRGNSLEEVQT